MDSIFRTMDRVFSLAHNFGPQEWGIIVAITVVFGYLCLRGMNIR